MSSPQEVLDCIFRFSKRRRIQYGRGSRLHMPLPRQPEVACGDGYENVAVLVEAPEAEAPRAGSVPMIVNGMLLTIIVAPKGLLPSGNRKPAAALPITATAR